jgi:hypothetical protein
VVRNLTVRVYRPNSISSSIGKIAKLLGMNMPSTLLPFADEVIEIDCWFVRSWH